MLFEERLIRYLQKESDPDMENGVQPPDLGEPPASSRGVLPGSLIPEKNADIPGNGAQNGSKLNVEVTKKRKEFFEVLDHVINYGSDRLQARYTRNSERPTWARILVQAVAAGGDLLNDAELEELSERITKLEKEVAKKNAN
jgi:hypothetical protein